MRKPNRFNSNALMMLSALEKQVVKKEELTAHQRKVLVKYYMEEMSHISNIVIGERIGVTDVHVGRIKRALLRNSLWQVEDIDVKMVAARLFMKMEEYQRKAVKAGDIALAWRIECDYIDKMQSFGYMPKKPDEILLRDKSVLRTRMEEFFDRYGVPNVEEFVARLESVGGDGNETRKLLEAGREPGDTESGDREPPEEGSSK